jgi:uncharacterized membrane protein
MGNISLILLLLAAVVVVEALMEIVKGFDKDEAGVHIHKRWYAPIAMMLSLGLSLVAYLASVYQGDWALIAIVGLVVYALQHFAGDVAVKRVKDWIQSRKL